jgi:glycosyltransferase involved in cell wall biosynthesis
MSDGLRVVFVVGQYFPVIGGTELQARKLAAELARLGVTVEVWTRRYDPAWPADELREGVRVRRLGRGRLLGLRRVARWEFMLLLLLEILRRGREFDVLHAHQLLYPAFVASLGARVIGRPCVARVAGAGTSSEFHPSNRGGIGLQLGLTRRLLTRVVATGAATRQECLRVGFPEDRVRVIPNGVALPETAARAPAGLQVLWVGRFRREKRPDLLVEAWRLARVSGSLTLVGDGPELPRVLRLAAGLPNVSLVGAAEDPAPYFAAADVFVLPSDAEGMSNALLEAMAAGCACVATDVGENRDLLGAGSASPADGAFVRGEAGLLVGSGDGAALAAALEALAAAPGLRRELGEAARTRARVRYSLASVAQEYLALYASLRRSS